MVHYGMKLKELDPRTNDEITLIWNTFNYSLRQLKKSKWQSSLDKDSNRMVIKLLLQINFHIQ